MKTLIELYDRRPIENVLSTEVFRPKQTIYLYPREQSDAKKCKQQLQRYFQSKHIQTELLFLEIDFYHADSILAQLERAVQAEPDCALDITGGSDAALFAAGLFCARHNIPVFTYSRKRNCFFNIRGCAFEQLPCTVVHSVSDCFLMAGGTVKAGHTDSNCISAYLPKVDDFFQLYLKYKSSWRQAVHYLQQASAPLRGAATPSLHVDAPTTVRDARGKQLQMPRELLAALAELRFLQSLDLSRKGRVSFDFRDEQIRTWLRDVGSVLELYVYKLCLASEKFNDVKIDVVVEWDRTDKNRNRVQNELDVVAMHGTLPVFISCKTGSLETEALNELAILRDRFGGEGAKAVAVSAQRCQSVTGHRAAALGITVVDIDDLRAGRLADILTSILSATSTKKHNTLPKGN